jgi:phosphomevalonate kinase
MQLDDEDICSPVYLGKYIDVPLPVHKTINYNNHNLHIVSYVLTDDDIKDKIYKMVGVNVFEKDKTNSLCSLDLAKHPDNNSYQLIYSNHKDRTVKVIKNIEKFPGREKVLEYVLEQTFEEPIKSILLS